MNRYTQSRARTSLVHTAVFRAVSQIATLLGYVVMVRGMSEQDFGVFALLYAFIPLVMSFASLGIEQTLLRYQPEYLRAGKIAAADWLVRVTLRARLASNVLILGAILTGWNWLAPFFHLAPYKREFEFFAIVVLLHFQTTLLQFSLASHMLHNFSVGMVAVLSLGKLVAYVGLLWFGTLTLQNAIFADAAAYALAYVGLRFAHERYCRPQGATERFRPDATERRRLLRYSVFNNFNEVGSFVINSSSDNFFIAAMVNPLAVGAYSFYTRLTQMSLRLLPLRMFDNVVQPVFFATPEADAAARLPRYFTFLINTGLIFLLPMVIFATACHEEIVAVLFSGKFISYSYLLPVVFGFLTMNIISGPVTLIAQYKEKAGVILASKITVIYSIVAMVLLLPRFGLLGAAIATGTGELMKNGFIWWHVRGTARWLNFRSVVAMGVLIWGGALAACYAVRAVFALGPLSMLALSAAICMGAGLLFARSPALAASDRELLASLLRGREGRILKKLGLAPA